LDIRIELPPNSDWLPRALRRATKAALLRARIVAGVLTAFGALLLIPSFNGDPDTLGPAVGLMVFGALMLSLTWRAPGRAMRRLPRYLRTEPMVLELTDHRLTQTHLSARAELHWPAFERAVETPDLWLLYLGRYQVMYVPKGPMDESQRAQFAAHLAACGLSARWRYAT
jgi:hypothetical protein